MWKTVIRSLRYTLPPACAYFVLGPAAAQFIDSRYGLVFPIPTWVVSVSLMLIPGGACLALWGWWLFARLGYGTPNPLAPPTRLVADGPFRFTRNPIMLGGWMASFGLALLLQSLSFLVMSCLVVITGAVYVRLSEEPRLQKRFGADYEAYARLVPRWLPRIDRRPFRAR